MRQHRPQRGHKQVSLTKQTKTVLLSHLVEVLNIPCCKVSTAKPPGMNSCTGRVPLSGRLIAVLWFQTSSRSPMCACHAGKRNRTGVHKCISPQMPYVVWCLMMSYDVVCRGNWTLGGVFAHRCQWQGPHPGLWRNLSKTFFSHAPRGLQKS